MIFDVINIGMQNETLDQLHFARQNYLKIFYFGFNWNFCCCLNSFFIHFISFYFIRFSCFNK